MDSFIAFKSYKHTGSFGAVGVESTARDGAEGGRASNIPQFF